MADMNAKMLAKSLLSKGDDEPDAEGDDSKDEGDGDFDEGISNSLGKAFTASKEGDKTAFCKSMRAALRMMIAEME